jgi:glycosyltransferase involved in cell wall biosynthesis
MELSIVVPAHNEEANIADTIKRIESSVAIPHEAIIVNDHSVDRTVQLIEDCARAYPRLRLAHNTMSQGFANAVITGINCARGDYVIPVMADLCDDLSTVGIMYEKMRQGYDVVCGSRYIRGGCRRGGPVPKALLSVVGSFLMHTLVGVPVHDVSNSFKMYRRDVLNRIALESRGFEISMEMLMKAHFLRCRITEVPTAWQERSRGRSSFKVMGQLPAYVGLCLWSIKKRIAG